MCPSTQPFHCVAHRTNLAAAVLDDNAVVAKVVHTVQSCHNYFAHSPKNVDLLKEMAVEAGTPGRAMQRIVSTR